MKQAYAYQVMWLIGGLKSICEADNRKEFLGEERYIKKIIRKNYRWYLKNPYIYWGEYILLQAVMLNAFKPVQYLLNICVRIYHKIIRN